MIEPDPDATPLDAVSTGSLKSKDALESRREQERLEAIDYDILKKFLDEPVVKRIFVEIQKEYNADWLASDVAVEREAIWAKSKALFDLAKELRTVFERGRTSKHARQARIAREEAIEKRKTR